MSPADRYLELGLRLGKHYDELIDTYWGPEEIAQHIDAEEPREPAVLVHEAEELLRGGGRRRVARRRGAGTVGAGSKAHGGGADLR